MQTARWVSPTMAYMTLMYRTLWQQEGRLSVTREVLLVDVYLSSSRHGAEVLHTVSGVGTPVQPCTKLLPSIASP
jgi:hypothetical protein